MLKVDNFNELQEWSHDLLKRISVVLSEPNLSAELSEAAQELRDVIIQQASAKFLYEAAVFRKYRCGHLPCCRSVVKDGAAYIRGQNIGLRT